MARRPLVSLRGGGREGSGSGPSSPLSEPSRAVPSPVFPVRAPQPRGCAHPPGGSHCAVHSQCVPLPRGRVTPAPHRGFPWRGVSPVPVFEGATFLQGCSLSLFPVFGGVISLWGVPCPVFRCLEVSPASCPCVWGVACACFPSLPKPVGAHANLEFQGVWGGSCVVSCIPTGYLLPPAPAYGRKQGFPLAVRQSLLSLCCCLFSSYISPFCIFLSAHLPGSAVLPLCPRTIRVSQCSSAKNCFMFFSSPSISAE